MLVFFRGFFFFLVHSEYEYFINLRILCEYFYISKSEIFISIFIFYFPIARGYCIVSELTVIHIIGVYLYVYAGLTTKTTSISLYDDGRGKRAGNFMEHIEKCVV